MEKIILVIDAHNPDVFTINFVSWIENLADALIRTIDLPTCITHH